MGNEGLSLTSLDISKGFLKAVLSLPELRQNDSVGSNELSAEPSRLILQLLSLFSSVPPWRW